MQEVEHDMLQLASDLLRLCDPNKLQHLYDDQTDCQTLSLAELHEMCLATFADWFRDLLQQFPVENFIAATSRVASNTENQTGLPDDLATAEMREQRAIDIVSSTGGNVHLNDSQPLTERFALLAHGKSIVDDQFARCIGTQVADSKVRLVNGIKAALAEDAFVKELLRDSTRTSPAEAAFMAAFEQHICGSDQFPHQLWRLVAVCQHHDIWVVDVLHWRFSCYSCHAGPLHIKGRLAKSGTHKVLSKEWNQPGYHFRIGQLAVLSALSEHGSGCTLYILDPSGKILSTSRSLSCQRLTPSHSL